MFFLFRFQGRTGFLLPPPDSGRAQTGLLCEQGGPPRSAEGRGRVWCAPRRCSLQLRRRLRRLQRRTSLPRSRRKMRKESQTGGRSPALLAGPQTLFSLRVGDFKTRSYWVKPNERVCFCLARWKSLVREYLWALFCGGVKGAWCGMISEVAILASYGFMHIKWFKWP